MMTLEVKAPGPPVPVLASVLTPAQAARSQAILPPQGSQHGPLWALWSWAVTATDPVSPSAELDAVTWCTGVPCGSGRGAPAG